MAVLPLIRNDLLLLARQRRWFIVRATLVALILTIVLILFHSVWKQVQYGTPIPFVAADAFRTFTFWALFFVLLPAPAFGVGAFEGAMKPGSLDLLRLASIPRPLLGWIKLLGAAVWPVLLAGSLIPFLALWPLWGGVELKMVLVSAALITSTAVCCAGLGLVGGSLGRSPLTAFGIGYGLALGYILLFPLLLSAVSYPLAYKLHAPLAMWEIAYGVGLGGIGNTQATDWLSPVLVCVGITVVSGTLSGGLLVLRDVTIARRTRRRGRQQPVTVRHALLWRELRTVGMRRARWLVRGSWVLSVLLIVGAEIMRQRTHSNYDGAFLTTLATAYPILPCLVVSILGAASVTMEKEAGTLTPVLLTPHSTGQILTAKILAILARTGPLFIAPFIYGITVVRHMLHLGDEELLLLIGLSSLFFQLGAFGVFCSVVFRRTSIALAITVVGGLAQIVAFGYMTGRFLDSIHLDDEIGITLWALEGIVIAAIWITAAAYAFRRLAVS